MLVGAPGSTADLPPVAVARLAVPRVAAPTVMRQRLLDALDGAIERPVTLVAGPPGAGKTLLLATWLAERKRLGTAAWLSLERSDSRPLNFWAAVLDSIEAAGNREVAALRSELISDRGDFLASFANAVAGRGEPLLLVLDDFHVLQAGEVCDELDELLRHPPDNLRLVIASRADPRLSLHRLRLDGRLAEVRAADLAFTLAETRELFAIAGLELSDEQLSALHDRTEGWSAGLRLAALSLQAAEDPDELVRTFAGDDSWVADYLVEEVLNRQPQPVRDFMLRTSVVDLVSPELASALTCRGNARSLLESLERSGAFLTPVDDRRGWYRYHPMFGELLRSELRHRMPDALALQHRRAAHWYAQRTDPVAAIEHALAAGDWQLAARLLSSGWFELLARGDGHELADLISKLPRELLVRDPEAAIAASAALLDSGEVDEARECMQLADGNASSVRAARRRDFTVARALVSLIRARLVGDFADAAATARKLLAGLGSGSAAFDARDRRTVALLNLGVAETWAGDLGRARRHLEDALTLAEDGRRDYLVLSALGPLSLLEALRGSIRRSMRLAQRGAALAEQHGWVTAQACAPARIALALCTYHLGSIADAGRQAERAKAAARASGERALVVLADIVRAMVMRRTGALEDAGLALRAARQEAESWELPVPLAVAIAAEEAAILAAEQRTSDAESTLERSNVLGGWGEFELMRARIALAEGDPDSAASRVVVGLSTEVPTLGPATAVGLHAVGGVAEQRCGRVDAALEHVERALRLAEPEGQRGILLEVGPPLRELLSRRIRAGTSHRALAGDLVDALDPRSPGSRAEEPLLIEPLSEREEAVLRYLPTVMSKAEVASEMFVSVNTVKTHTKSIYRKLDVTNRADAVRRAKSLGLI